MASDEHVATALRALPSIMGGLRKMAVWSHAASLTIIHGRISRASFKGRPIMHKAALPTFARALRQKHNSP
jgi:hypothetical protein